MKIIVDETVKKYIEDRLKIKIFPPSVTFGVVADNGRALCAFVFNNYNESNIDMTVVSEKGGLTRGVLRYLAHYVFEKAGCRRLTVLIKRRNKHAREMAKRFGFKSEYVMKRYFVDDDAIVFRLFKEECRWF